MESGEILITSWEVATAVHTSTGSIECIFPLISFVVSSSFDVSLCKMSRHDVVIIPLTTETLQRHNSF